MKFTLSNVLTFTVGAAIGSAVTYYIIKRNYDKIITKNILDDVNTDTDTDIPTGDAPDMYYDSNKEYEDIIHNNMYEYDEDDDEEEEDDVAKLEVISLEEFEDGENPTITLYYWADGVVTNDRNKEIANVDELIGRDNLKDFGDPYVDSVYIRNHDSEVDYEVLRDPRRFSEIS